MRVIHYSFMSLFQDSHPVRDKESIMDTTLTLGEGILLILGVCAIILLIHLIRAVCALIPTLKSLQKITEDTSKLTGIASRAAEGAEDAVTSLTDSAGDMADFIANNKSAVKALVSLINAVIAIRQLFGKQES